MVRTLVSSNTYIWPRNTYKNTYIWPRNTYKNTYIWHRNTYKNTYKKCLLTALPQKITGWRDQAQRLDKFEHRAR